MSVQAVSQWEVGKTTPTTINLMAIALVLNVPLQSLTSDRKRKERIFNKTSSLRTVPKVSFDFLYEMMDDPEKLEKVTYLESRIVSTEPWEDDLLALTIEDDSMIPDFEIGDIIILNSSLDPQPGDYVAMRDPISKSVLFRRHSLRLVEEPRRRHVVCLQPLNTHYPDFIIDPHSDNDRQHVLYGTLVEHRRLRPSSRSRKGPTQSSNA